MLDLVFVDLILRIHDSFDLVLVKYRLLITITFLGGGGGGGSVTWLHESYFLCILDCILWTRHMHPSSHTALSSDSAI